MLEPKIEKKHRLNTEISARTVHLIMGDGSSAGEVSLDQALYLAQQYGLDLVELNGNLNPPITKLMDYNKYRYQQEKNARGHVKVKNDLKEIRLGFKIDKNDIATKAKRAREFMENGHFVRVFINLRGRENVFPDKAKQTLELFRNELAANLEQPISHEGKKVQMIISLGKK